MPETRSGRVKKAAQGIPLSPPVSLPTTRARATANAGSAIQASTSESAPNHTVTTRTTRLGGRGPTRPTGVPGPVNKPKRRKAAPKAGKNSAAPAADISDGPAIDFASPLEQNSAEDTDDQGQNDVLHSNRKKPFASSSLNLVPLHGHFPRNGQLDVPYYQPRTRHPVFTRRNPSNAFKFESLGAPKESQSILHLLVRGQDEERAVAMNIPAEAINHLVAGLVKKYGVIENAPKLTLATEKRKPSLEEALTGKVSNPNWPHLRCEYYQQRQDKPGRSQHYRMVEPFYDEDGNSVYPPDGRVFVPILGDEDDSDLDTELDEASSSFKENISVERKNDAKGQNGNSEFSSATSSSSGADTQGLEEGALVLEDAVHGEVLPDAPAAQAPETPRTRWVLGNLFNTASRLIPRLGRVTTNAPPTDANLEENIPLAKGPATPTQPTSHTNHLPIQTEPRHPTQPQTPSFKPDVNTNRAASVHIKGQARNREDLERLNVRRRLDKSRKRKELDNIEAEAAKLQEERDALQREKRQLKENKKLWDAYRKTNPLPDTDAALPGFGMRATRRTREAEREKARTGSDGTVIGQRLFGPPREPYAPGSRISEARANARRKRRRSSPETIPNPDGGGYGINEKFFYGTDDDDDDTATTTSRGKKAPCLDDLRDSSLPVGDPHKARPATGTYVHDEADEPHLQGGNIFRDDDVHKENLAKAAKAKDAATAMPPMTPNGVPITNLSGHFQVPDNSDSDSDSDSHEDSEINPTPAPKRSVKESLGEMSIFRGDSPSSPSSASAPKPTVSPERTESLPPLPRAPVPVHATLPAKAKAPSSRTPSGFKTGPRTAKYLEKALSKSTNSLPRAEPRTEDSDGLKAARAKALQFTPAKSSNLRESHLADSSPLVPADDASAEPSTTAENSAHTPHPDVPEASVSLADDDAATAGQVSPNNGTTGEYNPEEQVLFHGQWVSGKVANFVNNNFTAEDEEVWYKMVKEECTQYMRDHPTPPLFSRRVEAVLETPEWQQAIAEAGEAMVPDIKRGFERGFPL